MTIEQHGFGPELGRKPITHDERSIAHTPRRLTTVPAVAGSPTHRVEIASTPHGDEHDAVEIRVIVPDGEPGHFRSHMAIVRRSNLPLLIEELEAHRLDKDLDPCRACAAQTFAARLTDDAARTKHTCPEPPQPRSPEEP